MEQTDFERRLIINLDKYAKSYNNINDFMVQFIEQAGSYLNLQTIADYAKENRLSYNGVKNNREIKTIFNTKFVIDNL